MKYYKDAAGNVYAYSDIQTPECGLILMTETEAEAHLNPVPTSEQQADTARTERDVLIAELEPRLLRYERQERLGIETNDSEAWYLAALHYLQDLRDVPQQEGFPQEYEMPEVPD